MRNSERALLDSDREGPSARPVHFVELPGSDETVALRPEITPQIAHRTQRATKGFRTARGLPRGSRDVESARPALERDASSHRRGTVIRVGQIKSDRACRLHRVPAQARRIAQPLHKVGDGESWLADDIEAYQEAVAI